MNPEARDKQDRLDALAALVRQGPPPLSARQRSAGWQCLQQAMASRRSLPDESPVGWWRVRGLRLGFALGAVAIVVGAPMAWRMRRTTAPESLRYVVNGDVSIDSRGAGGEILWAPTGGVRLFFTDGSGIGMHPSTRLAVVGLKARGSDIRLLDGTVDVDVRHRAGATWTFEAGPYAVHVTGTSFVLGWNAAQRRLELRMRSGLISLAGPTGVAPRAVKGGESVFLDASGSSWAPSTPEDRRPAGSAVSGVVAAAAPSPRLSPAGGAAASPRARLGSSGDHDQRTTRLSRAHADWTALLARGEFDTIVEQANASGSDEILAVDTAASLAALADAARYTHRADLARRALLAVRVRFPATDRARDAAFFLARLSETTGRDMHEALSWYAQYLSAAPGGSYEEEALGREMILLRRSDEGNSHARDVARRYVSAYPHGIYASAAAGLLQDAPAP
jgi:transmembrane sensor